MATATTLPRITPGSTPVPPAITAAVPVASPSHSAPTFNRSFSSTSLYGPYPPPELSSSVDYVKIPQRINPLAPNPPKKRINVSWETTDQHFENEKRRLLMQKREHTRYHSAWAKPFYGMPAEKEAYRRHCREVLKQQMLDREIKRRVDLKEKVTESEHAVAYDRSCRLKDAEDYFRKHLYLQQYRDSNKKAMEQLWQNTKYNTVLENLIDREKLRYNPINWSCTLK